MLPEIKNIDFLLVYKAVNSPKIHNIYEVYTTEKRDSKCMRQKPWN